MHSLKHEIGNVPLSMLKIPATHDSATYNISEVNEYGVDTNYDAQMMIIPQLVNVFTQYALKTSLIKKFVAPWFKTQECTILQQLNHGIRHFDLRVCKQTVAGSSEKFHICHGMLSVSVRSVLEQVNDFLKGNNTKHEVISLDFNHVYGFTTMADHLEFMNMTSRVLGLNSIVDRAVFGPTSTLNQIWTTSQRVFLHYINTAAVNAYGTTLRFGLSSSLNTTWANKQDMASLHTELLNELRTRPNMNTFFVTQALMTPSLEMMVEGLFAAPSSIKQMAQMKYGIIPDWITDEFPTMKTNIVNTDFYNLRTERFVKAIIQKNL